MLIYPGPAENLILAAVYANIHWETDAAVPATIVSRAQSAGTRSAAKLIRRPLKKSVVF